MLRVLLKCSIGPATTLTDREPGETRRRAMNTARTRVRLCRNDTARGGSRNAMVVFHRAVQFSRLHKGETALLGS